MNNILAPVISAVIAFAVTAALGYVLMMALDIGLG